MSSIMSRSTRASRSGSVLSEASEEQGKPAVDSKEMRVNADSDAVVSTAPPIADIPDGRPRSGRFHKTKQAVRTSLSKSTTMRKTYETHKSEREKYKAMKLLEKEIKAEKDQKKADEKARREERDRRRKENEFKTSSFQQINGEKIKKMSKKQLKNIAKTSMGKTGLELVSAFKK